MIKIIISLIVTLLFCFGIANAQGITVSHVDGAWDNNTKVKTGQPVTWYLRVDTHPASIWGFSTGFRVFISSDGTIEGLLDPGPGFTPITCSTLITFDAATYSEYYYGVGGFGADTVGFGTVGGWGYQYIQDDTWKITTQVENHAADNYLCIDSSWFPPNGPWLWEVDGPPWLITPYWDGPHCYLIEPCCQQRGDVIGDPIVLIDDLTLLANYIFKSGPPPDCLDAGDVVIDDLILVNDLVFLVNYIFKGGDAPPPCD